MKKILASAFATLILVTGLAVLAPADFLGNVTLGKDGSLSAPVITFNSDNALGFYRDSSGVMGLAGALKPSGGIVVTAGAGYRATPVFTAAATLAVTSSHCGRTIVSTLGSGTQTFTLPASGTVAGCEIKFLAGNASTEILINTAAATEIVNIMTFAAVGTDADTARVIATSDTTAIKNTAATNVIGDSVYLVADGSLTWYGIGITAGIWAAQ